MEMSHSVAQELRLLAGNVRALVYLMEPLPDRPDVDSANMIKCLDLLAVELDRLAMRTETCRICPFNVGGSRL